MYRFNKVLIALLVVVALVAMFELTSAQYGRGGYGGGRGFGGGRGYGGYGGRGGYGGYGGRGGYGGGRGYGGYGGGRGGYGGYGRGYRGYHDTYDQTYPSYGGGSGYGSAYGSTSYGSMGGYYDDTDIDDYSSYLDVYAASSSTPSSSATTAGQLTGGSTPSARGWQPESAEAQVPQWALSSTANQAPTGQLDTAFGGFADNQGNFDLITGADQDQLGSGQQRASERQRQLNVLLASQGGRQSGINPANRSSTNNIGNGNQQLLVANNTPTVPTSTTTPAPDYIMINPTTTTTRTSA